jgi:hypothetical protein
MRALLREARLHARRTRALRVCLTGSSAGHGVHRSNSTSASGMIAQKVHRRGQRDHREAPPSLARAARIPPSSVSSVVNPSSAWHGLHRPFSNRAPSTSISVHLRSSAASIPFSAGHGVHRSNSNSAPAPASPRPVRPRATARSIPRRLCSSLSPLSFFSAGHGVHPLFSSFAP